jgi:hypothetical protein
VPILLPVEHKTTNNVIIDTNSDSALTSGD